MCPDPALETTEPRPTPTQAPRTDVIPRVTSQELLGSCGQLVIAHDGREYRLRITQNGKLILTA